jgi:simple sugar transport system ATP-binding protein
MRVEMRDIHKHFGDVHANDGISVTFEQGRIYGLLGENGAGKSTLMKILSGYQAQTSGEIFLDGKSVRFSSPSSALHAGIGMLYQDPHDFPPFRVVENYQLAYDQNLVLDLKARERQVRNYSARFGFEIDPDAYIETLTLGERQQIELLRLLALGANVLILDEPTTGISAVQKNMLFNTMRLLVVEEHKTIILVSHKLEEVQELCSEVFILRKGLLTGHQNLPCPTSDLVKQMFGAEITRISRASTVLNDTVLKIKNACVHTHLLNVDNLNLELHSGEVLGLAGLEGSGQNLLLQSTAGLISLQSGNISLDGKPITEIGSPVSFLQWIPGLISIAGSVWGIYLGLTGQASGVQSVGTVIASLLIALLFWLLAAIAITSTSRSAYHEFKRLGGAYIPADRLREGLVTGLTLVEHMALVGDQKSISIDWSAANLEIDRLIKHYNIIGYAETRVDNLSGGNQQRTMLALLQEKLRLVLMEHPTRGLDVASSNWIWEMFQQRQKEGTAIMFMSADLDELLERSDRIAVFSSGVMSRIVDARATTVEELGHLIGGQTS